MAKNQINFAANELVAFSTNGIDTHGAYSRGLHSGLINLLNKLDIAKGVTCGGTFTVPISGIYQVITGSAANHTVVLQMFKAGDNIDVIPSLGAHIHRLGS